MRRRIRRRDFLKTVGAAAFALPGACAAFETRPGSKPNIPGRKPNIIFLLADDLGYAELGCFGQKHIRTPFIDRIAAEGIRFTQHYSGSPVCAPSRCVLMTGKHTGHAFVRDNGNPKGRKLDAAAGEFPGQIPIPESTVTIAELLKAEGYATAAIGKWGLGHVGSTGDPNRQGFDLFFGYNCQVHAHNHYPRFLWRNDERITLDGNDRTLHGEQYSQDLFIAEALRFIRGNRNRPFFLYMPFIIPHLSIQVPEESLAEYRGKIPEEKYEHRGYLEHPAPRAGYAAMITHMDRGIGQIMDLVKELGLDEDTLFVFTSDNGPTYDRLGGSDSDFFESAGPFRGLKGSVYEGGIRVPMVVRWPGRIESGRESRHQCAFWDVMPTLCDVAGARKPDGIDGISFAPALLGAGEQEEHEYLYWEFPSYGGQQAVRLGDWKGVRQGMFMGRMQTELYDLAADIGEKRDVAAEHPEVVARIESIMEEARVESAEFPLMSRVKAAERPPLPEEGAIPRDGWKLVRVDSESTHNGKLGVNAFDGDPATWWHTEWRDAKPPHPHEIVIDLGQTQSIRGFRYLPRGDLGTNGTIADYEFFVASDPDALGRPVASGSFEAAGKDKAAWEVTFSARKGRYVCLRALSAVNGGPFTSVGEIIVLGN